MSPRKNLQAKRRRQRRMRGWHNRFVCYLTRDHHPLVEVASGTYPTLSEVFDRYPLNEEERQKVADAWMPKGSFSIRPPKESSDVIQKGWLEW